MVGDGARFPQRTPVIFGSGGPLGAFIGEGKVQTGGARAAAASTRSAGQASDRTCGLARSGHFQTLIGSQSSRNSAKSLHTISSLSFTLSFSYST
jgi:hypothetical protein